MKKILLFMLLFVNLQIVIKVHTIMFKAGADVMAQHMYQEPGDNCFEPVYKFYYKSAFTLSLHGIFTIKPHNKYYKIAQ